MPPGVRARSDLAPSRTPSPRRRSATWLALVCAVCLGAGCTSAKSSAQRAAKDWCLTLRGSQVIPVYPLTEDLQPGDVFLVSVPVDRQQELYDRHGFLPLDQHLARLQPAGYTAFYEHSFIDPQHPPRLPRDWLRPTRPDPDPESDPDSDPDPAHGAWQPAPRVAFPTYAFSVRRGAGLNLAVPVQGVPVGLSLLGTDAADGSVALGEARTLGVDTVSLYHALRSWAATNGDFLLHFGADPAGKRPSYLRVVTRVYAAGAVDVSLRAADSRSGGVDVGAPKPVDLLFPKLPDATHALEAAVQRNFTNGWATLQQLVHETADPARDAAGRLLPGASLRLTGASARTVSLHERFHPPLIVGYLGFDVALHPGGVLGPPIPTQAVLTSGREAARELERAPMAAIHAQAALLDIYRALRAADRDTRARRAADRLDALERHVPPGFVAYDLVTHPPPVLSAQTLPASAASAPYERYHRFTVRLAQSLRALETALAGEGFELTDATGRRETVTPGTPRWLELERVARDYGRVRDAGPAVEAARRARLNAVVQYLQLDLR